MIDLTCAPSEFDEATYLRLNPDVAAALGDNAIPSAWAHVLIHGYKEGRMGLSAEVVAAVRQHYNSFQDGNVRIPPPQLRKRVHGAEDIESFLTIGQNIANNIDATLDTENIVLPSNPIILDFGCGCGRVMSHLRPRHVDWAFSGCDIDGEAIRWTVDNLNDIGQFIKNDDWPPLNFQPSTFDMIYSISVFTHLPEDMQFAWLDELRRVTKIGGLALLSVHGMDLAGSEHDPDLKNGFHFAVTGGTEGLPDFYQTSFHSVEYIREKWQSYFDILNILPKRIASHQDLVVCRRCQ